MRSSAPATTSACGRSTTTTGPGASSPSPRSRGPSWCCRRRPIASTRAASPISWSPQLEGIDKTSTFFEEVYRLPPAHALTVTPEGVRLRRYWTLEPGPELRLPSDEAYAEAFLEVFTEAVRCRLRGAGPVGSMLSGGMDSGSVVAVARGLLAEAGQGPLPTFSAVGPDPRTCIETRAIQAALTMDGLDPCTVSHARAGGAAAGPGGADLELDEPFDYHMTLVRVLYLAAHRQGVKALLDGIDGDTCSARAATWPACCAAGVG